LNLKAENYFLLVEMGELLSLGEVGRKDWGGFNEYPIALYLINLKLLFIYFFISAIVLIFD
jgi:hypothetical protein